MASANAEVRVLDESEKDESVASVQYEISSYGADYDVYGLVRRLNKEEIFIPKFQRGYVWKEKEASRFIESLLLGLPVPGIFTATDSLTNKMFVIDGQQRLRTLQFFLNGFFNPQQSDKKHRVFALSNVQDRFKGKTFQTLHEKDRIKLENTTIHTTIIKQESPKDDDTSIYHIFERLNTGGQKLNQQEIRVAAYYGPIFELLTRLNTSPNWRRIFGKTSARLKDQELILRFLALHYQSHKYEKPFSEFLTKFAIAHRNPPAAFTKEAEQLFEGTICVVTSLGKRAFRPEGTLNAAVFDSVMVGVAARVKKGPIKDNAGFARAYDYLVSKNPAYEAAVKRATSDEQSVRTRVEEATKAFLAVK
jgi:Protein of unknown function DUF262